MSPGRLVRKGFQWNHNQDSESFTRKALIVYWLWPDAVCVFTSITSFSPALLLTLFIWYVGFKRRSLERKGFSSVTLENWWRRTRLVMFKAGMWGVRVEEHQCCWLDICKILKVLGLLDDVLENCFVAWIMLPWKFMNIIRRSLPNLWKCWANFSNWRCWKSNNSRLNYELKYNKSFLNIWRFETDSGLKLILGTVKIKRYLSFWIQKIEIKSKPPTQKKLYPLQNTGRFHTSIMVNLQ